jgi:hypothetical protein
MPAPKRQNYKMIRAPVQSSSIAEIGFEDGVLEIMFRTNRVYQYFDVPAQVHQALISAESIGRYFNENIRDRYRVVEVS